MLRDTNSFYVPSLSLPPSRLICLQCQWPPPGAQPRETALQEATTRPAGSLAELGYRAADRPPLLLAPLDNDIYYGAAEFHRLQRSGKSRARNDAGANNGDGKTRLAPKCMLATRRRSSVSAQTELRCRRPRVHSARALHKLNRAPNQRSRLWRPPRQRALFSRRRKGKKRLTGEQSHAEPRWAFRAGARPPIKSCGHA